MTYRRMSALVVLVVGCMVATIVRAEPLTYTVVSGDSSVTFQTSAIERIIGGTSELSGTIVIDPDHPGTGAHANIVIATPSLQSDNHDRDKHMHVKALQSREYPKIVLKATGVSTAASRLADGSTATLDIAATLELHGQTQPVTFPVSVTRKGDTLTIDGETSLLMTDYGIKPPRLLLLTVRNLTEIRFHIVAKRGTP